MNLLSGDIWRNWLGSANNFAPIRNDYRQRAEAITTRLVAGGHSGRNADWVTAQPPPGERWLWLVGALQRPLAAARLEAASSLARQSLAIADLPMSCPCCAPGAMLSACISRALRQQETLGLAVDGLILQVAPETDSARLADRLREPPCDGWVQVCSIEAVLAPAELPSLGLASSAGRGRLRCLGSATRVAVATASASAAGLNRAMRQPGRGRFRH